MKKIIDNAIKRLNRNSTLDEIKICAELNDGTTIEQKSKIPEVVAERVESINRIYKIAKEHLEKGRCKIWVLDGGSSKEEFDYLYKMISELDNIESIAPAIIGPALALNTGPGLLGLIVQEV